MSATKRKASTRSNRVASRVTEFSDEVLPMGTIEREEMNSHSTRHSKRVKREVECQSDFEDLKAGQEEFPKPDQIAVKDNAGVVATASGSSQKKSKPIAQVLDKPHPAPTNWKEAYDAIKTLRSRFVAPVDTMGCQLVQVAESDPKCKRYSTLVALMLSTQTKDEVMFAAATNLREALGGSISIEAMIAADDKVITDAIAKVGFWRKKTMYLKEAAIKLRDDFDSDVPKTFDELCSLRGVGPKVALLCLQMAWNVNRGIGVDIHVHRITNRLGWHKPPTQGPEETRLNLESWFPEDLYKDINHTMVGYGQVICLPIKPRCDVCDAGKRGLCPSREKAVKASKSRKTILFTDIEESEESPPKIEIALEEGAEAIPPSL